LDTTRPCSCQGNNERCFKCDGTGFVQDLGDARPTPVARSPYPWEPALNSRSKGQGRKKKSAVRTVPVQQSRQQKPAPPRTLLCLPDLNPPPPYLVRDGVQYTHCKHCTLYVATPRFLVHEEICVRVPPRSKSEKPSVVPPVDPSRISASPRIPSSVVGNREWTSCHLCNSDILAKNLSRHVQRVHGPMTRENSATESLPPAQLSRAGQRYHRCSHCGQYIKSEQILVHTGVCTWRSSQRPKLAAKGAPPRLDPAARPLLKLAKEHAQPGERVNSVSVQNVPVQTVRARTSLQCVATSAQATHTNKAGAVWESAYAAAENNMLARSDRSSDASRFLGYFARENGRFGSMPSYDGYDDESDAD
jgi:hypothetical protein